MAGYKHKLFNPFPAEFSSQVKQFLGEDGPNAQLYRQGILDAAQGGSDAHINVYHGAAPQPERYTVDEMKRSSVLRGSAALNVEQSDVMFQLLLKNFNHIANRQLDKGEVPGWDLFQSAMRDAAGMNLQGINRNRNELRQHLMNAKTSNEQQHEIEKLNKKLAMQKSDFDKKFNQQSDEERKRKAKEKEERDRAAGESPRPKEPGIAGLFQQSQRYDTKTLAWMGLTFLAMLPLDFLKIAVQAGVKVSPETPEEWLKFFGTWMTMFGNQFEKRFGFGDDGRQAPSKKPPSSGDDAHIQQAGQQRPGPKPG